MSQKVRKQKQKVPGTAGDSVVRALYSCLALCWRDEFHSQKQLAEERVCLVSVFRSLTILREAEVGAQREAWRQELLQRPCRRELLRDLFFKACSAFLHPPGPPTVNSALLSQSLIKETPCRQSGGEALSLLTSFSRMTLACFKLRKKTDQDTALAENWSSVPRTLIRQLTSACDSGSRGPTDASEKSCVCIVNVCVCVFVYTYT